MSTTLLGADADELERIARSLRSAADELDGHAGSLTATLRSVAWVGGVATRFGSSWTGSHRPRMISTAQYVRDAAVQLDRNAAEQRRASAATVDVGGGTGSGPPGPDGPGGPGGPGGAAGSGGLGGAGGSSGPIPTEETSTDDPGSPLLDRLEQVLDTLGLGRDVLEILSDHLDLLEGKGLEQLISLLENDGFLAALDTAGDVLDIGGVVIDLAQDFAEHAHLPFDERIVHALADAATRFGIDQGVEVAAEFLASAAIAAILPGLGVALAPLAGQLVGAVVDVVIGEIIDAVDGATDVVDIVADAAVDAYQAIKDTFGLVLDAAGAVIDVADAALDLAGDAAGAVIDAGGAVIDFGGDLVGGINPFD